jgi:2-keto-4-pentenoate hydratase
MTGRPVTPAAQRPAWADPLSAALWAARATRVPIRRADWPGVTAERGAAVAAELYAALAARTGPPIGLKLGATDAQTRVRFALAEPFAAPLFGDALLDSGACSLSELIAPRLEAEIGVRLDGDTAVAVACVEIVDCRVQDWDLDGGLAVADFGLQGRVAFGTAPLASEVTVTITHDGRTVASAGPLPTADRVDVARTRAAAAPGLVSLVASGSLSTPLALVPGRWRITYGEEALELCVTL